MELLATGKFGIVPKYDVNFKYSQNAKTITPEINLDSQDVIDTIKPGKLEVRVIRCDDLKKGFGRLAPLVSLSIGEQKYETVVSLSTKQNHTWVRADSEYGIDDSNKNESFNIQVYNKTAKKKNLIGRASLPLSTLISLVPHKIRHKKELEDKNKRKVKKTFLIRQRTDPVQRVTKITKDKGVGLLLDMLHGEGKENANRASLSKKGGVTYKTLPKLNLKSIDDDEVVNSKPSYLKPTDDKVIRRHKRNRSKVSQEFEKRTVEVLYEESKKESSIKNNRVKNQIRQLLKNSDCDELYKQYLLSALKLNVGDIDFMSRRQSKFWVDLQGDKKGFSGKVLLRISYHPGASIRKKQASNPNGRLIIDSELTDLTKAVEESPYKIPLIVHNMFKYIVDLGIEKEGIFRKAGNQLKINQCIEAINNNDAIILDDLHVTCDLLKSYLHDLKNPLLNGVFMTELTKMAPTNFTKQVHDDIDKLVNDLPVENRDLLIHLMKFCKQVATHQDKNKMKVYNMAVVFTPGIVRTDYSCPEKLENVQNEIASIGFLIENSDKLFPQELDI